MPQIFAEHGGSSSSQDPVTLEPPRAGSDIFSKTKMCKFNLLGVCIKGSACMFAHHQDELKPVPDLFRTKICKTLINTGSCNDPECRYAHNKEELRAAAVLAKPKPPRKPAQPPVQRAPPQRAPAARAQMLPTTLPMASVDGFGIPMLQTDASGLHPVGQIVPVPMPMPVAMPVGLVAWPEPSGASPLWKQPRPKVVASGTRRGRRGKGQRGDSNLQPPTGSRRSHCSGCDQEDSPIDFNTPHSFSTQTTATSSSGSAGCPYRAPGMPGQSSGGGSSRDSSSDTDLQLEAGMARAQARAQEVLQEAFDTDEEQYFGSHDLQYHAEQEQVDFDGPHGSVMVKNTFLEFEPDAPPPVLKKVHTAAGRLQELGVSEDSRHRQ